jgi:four helix bundle protein
VNPKTAALQERTRAFATRVVDYCSRLPPVPAAQVFASQLIDAAGGTDSNYRATCRARSLAEFIAKIGVAAEEADEAKGWLLLLVESSLATRDASQRLIQEADELVAIFVASRKTAERRQARERMAKKIDTSARRHAPRSRR